MTRLEQNVSQFISCFMLCQMSRDFCRKPVTKLEKEKKFTNIFDVLMSYQKIILYLKQEGDRGGKLCENTDRVSDFISILNLGFLAIVLICTA